MYYNVVLDIICEYHNYIEAKMTQSLAPRNAFDVKKLSKCPSPFCDAIVFFPSSNSSGAVWLFKCFLWARNFKLSLCKHSND